MTLGNRVLIYFLILGALASAIYGYFLLHQEKSYAEDQIINRTEAFGESMREILEANLPGENFATLKKFLNRIAVFEQPLGMRVFMKSGELFYETKSLTHIPVGNVLPLIKQIETEDPDEAIVTRLSHSGKPLVVCSFALKNPEGDLLGVLQIYDAFNSSGIEYRGYQRKVFSSLILFYVFILSTIFFLIQRNINKPIAGLIKELQSRSKKSNKLSQGHEISILKQEFEERESHLQELENVLSKSSQEKEALIRQLKQSENLAVLGKFAAGLAHEMGSPLSVIEGRASQSLRKLDEKEVLEKNLTLIVGQSKLVSNMIEDVLTFARRRPLRRTPVDINKLIHQTLELFEGLSEKQVSRVEVIKDFQDNLPLLQADPDQLVQVFSNLIRNALQAMPSGGVLSLHSSQVLEDQQLLPWIKVSVQDSGLGMSSEVQAKLFEPFFSAKQNGQGTGLGLSIVFGIVEEHQGKITVHSQESKGSRFDVYLPVGL
ncbi:MAG: hypothetical protein HQM15_00080 [Deltaproteobacteria bacterium]|nr:hypothetical protein [Deltaproteobacteria bacterium]